MFLKAAIRLKKKSELSHSRFLKKGAPWVFSNELQAFDKTLPPGSWVSLESADGETLGYGFFNPHSLIAYRSFERASFRSEEQTRALFFKRVDAAWRLRVLAYGGSRSVRLTFGESDGLPGLITDLFESEKGGLAIIQCHSAGSDQLIYWMQQWLDQRLGIRSGVVRNDLDVRHREKAPLEVVEWGEIPSDVWAMEGGLRFYFDLKSGQKTGFFYDHRDNRLALAKRAAFLAHAPGSSTSAAALDCFSYVGAWGLALAKANPKMKVVCLDVSKPALEMVLRNAAFNGLKDQVEVLAADFFHDKKALENQKFQIVVSDPPSMSASAKHSDESRRAHERCFYQSAKLLAPQGLAAFAACSYHLKWDEFMEICARVGQSRNRSLVISHLGGQSADHPVLSSLLETRYLKCAFLEELDSWS